MLIKEGLNLKPQRGSRIEIPDCSRNDLPQFFVDQGYKTGVEIGVYAGEFTEKFCKVGLKMYAIDPYMVDRDYQRKQSTADLLYKKTKDRLAPYNNCEIIKKTSMDAVKDFEDESLDFIYIDGNHQLKYVIEDIFEWLFKIKKGGVISGHDYYYARPTASSLGQCHVRYAVDAYVGSYGIKKYYILGELKADENHRDKWRSWMFFKE